MKIELYEVEIIESVFERRYSAKNEEYNQNNNLCSLRKIILM